MNFVIIPALIGPLLGPTVGGLIVHWLSWRDIFFVNVPVGLAGLCAGRAAHAGLPRAETPRRSTSSAWCCSAPASALLSWLLEVFGEHTLPRCTSVACWRCSLSLLLAATAGTRGACAFPLLRLALFACAPSASRCWAASSRGWASAACPSCCRCCTSSGSGCRRGSRAC